MPLDPRIAAILERSGGARATADMTVAEARHADAALFAELPAPVNGPADVVDGSVTRPIGASIPIRGYRPIARAAPPIIVYFHDGGWVVGSIAISDRFCRTLAAATGCIVVSVEYRLAPEHKFPAAVEDALAATSWVMAHAAELGGNPKRIGVAGEGAGGNLAAVVALLIRDQRGPRLGHQLLLYPNTDLTRNWPSMSEEAEGYGLTQRALTWFAGHYLNTELERGSPLVSPLRAQDHARLPRALIITAEHDPLRDEGEAYGEKLRGSRVPVKVSRYDGMIHGFIAYHDEVEAARQALAEIDQELRKAFRRTVE